MRSTYENDVSELERQPDEALCLLAVGGNRLAEAAAVADQSRQAIQADKIHSTLLFRNQFFILPLLFLPLYLYYYKAMSV